MTYKEALDRGYKMLFARESNIDDVTTLWRIWDEMKQNALA